MKIRQSPVKGLRRAVQVEVAAYLEGSETPNPLAMSIMRHSI